jgi:hypothetical protein
VSRTSAHRVQADPRSCPRRRRRRIGRHRHDDRFDGFDQRAPVGGDLRRVDGAGATAGDQGTRTGNAQQIVQAVDRAGVVQEVGDVGLQRVRQLGRQVPGGNEQFRRPKTGPPAALYSARSKLTQSASSTSSDIGWSAGAPAGGSSSAMVCSTASSQSGSICSSPGGASRRASGRRSVATVLDVP